MRTGTGAVVADFTSVEVAGIALVVGFPLLLMLAVVLLGRLERWILHPDERAERVQQLLEEVDEAEAIERATAQFLAPAADEYARRARNGNGSRVRRRAVSRSTTRTPD